MGAPARLLHQATFHRRSERYPHGAQSGKNAEQKSRQHSERGGKAKHARVRRQVKEDIILVGRDVAHQQDRSHCATKMPSRAPAQETSRHSVKSWRTSRPRDAPSALRTAISLLREAARASIRLARLAEAISNTSPTMPIRTASGLPNWVRSSEIPVAAGMPRRSRRRKSCCPAGSQSCGTAPPHTTGESTLSRAFTWS